MVARERLGGALLIGAFAASALLAIPHAMAQQYPDRPITIVHNYGSGTASDATARMIAEAALSRS
jgi:tripartite-type tricarboxylate transporter receptor subunit TctC